MPSKCPKGKKQSKLTGQCYTPKKRGSRCPNGQKRDKRKKPTGLCYVPRKNCPVGTLRFRQGKDVSCVNFKGLLRHLPTYPTAQRKRLMKRISKSKWGKKYLEEPQLALVVSPSKVHSAKIISSASRKRLLENEKRRKFDDLGALLEKNWYFSTPSNA